MVAQTKSRRGYAILRRCLRFNLRFLLIAVTLAAVALGTWMQQTRRQKSTVELIKTLGGEVHYSYELEEDAEGFLVPTSPLDPPGPSWIRSQMGIDFFDSVAAVRLRLGGNASSGIPWPKELATGPPISPLRSRSSYTSAIPAILALTELRTLELSGIEIRDEDLLQLQHLTKLEQLALYSTTISQERFAYVGKLTQLEALDLYATGISDDGMRHLKNLTKLTYLSLCGEVHSGQGLKHLTNMQELRTLDLRRVNITDADLEPLGKLTSLENLYLSNTPITTSGLVYLFDLKKLRILDVSGCNIPTDHWIKQLEQRNPKILISR